MLFYPDDYYFEPLTLVYLLKDSQVLLLRRSPNKSVLPNTLLGLGGKVEANESIIQSAIREVKEESGYTLKSLDHKGAFTFINKVSGLAGIVHLFVSRDFSGKEDSDDREGTLEWHSIKDLEKLDDLAKHQLHFIPDILINHNTSYLKTHVYNLDGSIEIVDQVPEFDIYSPSS